MLKNGSPYMQRARLLVHLLAVAFAAQAGSQTITTVTPANPTKSGLVRITGTGFGNGTNSGVLIFGRFAPIARWTDTLIECYVPEATPAISVKAAVLVPTGRKAAFALQVRDRQVGAGRLKWRFEAADQYIIAPPAIGPDGTIYALGNFGHLYAIDPSGAIKWVWSGGVDGMVDVGPDGRIYCGGGGGVQAFSPEGIRLWTHPLNSAKLAGPNVGPDGLVYAVDNARWSPNPSGMVVLNNTGQELWRGGVFYMRGGSHSNPVQFDQNRAYVWSEKNAQSGSIGGLQSILLGGGLDWVNPNIVGIQSGAYASGGVVAHGTSTTQKMSTNGNVLWSFDLWSIGGSQPTGAVLAAPDGGAYFMTVNTRMNALAPNGALRFTNVIGGIVNYLTLKPDGSVLLLQKSDNFGQPSRIQAYNANGALLWQTESLPIENGTTIVAYNQFKFAPSGFAYFGTAGPMLTQTTANSYIYALDAR